MFCLSDSVGTGDDAVGDDIGKARILHPLGNGKSAGDGHQHVPRQILAVFARIEDARPCHDDGRDADEEEHVEAKAWNVLADEGQLAHRGADYHEEKQDDGQIAFLMAERLAVAVVARDEESRRVAIGLYELVVGLEEQRVVVLQGHIRPVALKQGASSANGVDVRSVVTVEVELPQVSAKAGEAASQNDFDQRDARGLVFLFIVFALPFVGQKVVAIEDEVSQADDADDDAYLSNLEHRHALSARILNQAVDHEVCARADEGADAAKDGGVAQGDEELGVWQSHFSCPVLDDWSKDDHDGGVVQEGRQGGDGGQQTSIGSRHGRVLFGQQSKNDLLQDAAPANAFAHEEKQRHRYHSLVRETFQALFGAQNTSAKHHHNAGEQNEPRLQLVCYQCPNHEHQAEGYIINAKHIIQTILLQLLPLGALARALSCNSLCRDPSHCAQE